MSVHLRQSTASQARAIGPFIDDTDFKTPETALSIANTDIKLVVNGAASVNKNSGGGTHRINGVYGLTFDATDTATVGEMMVSVVVAGALPVFKTFVVVEEAVYDALFVAAAPGFSTVAAVNTIDDFLDTEIAAIKAVTDALVIASGRVNANLMAINSNTDAPVILDRQARAVTIGTVGAASSTISIVTSSLTPAAAVTDQFKGQVVQFDRNTTTTNLRGQKTDITASTAGGVLTVTALTTAPVSGDTFVIG